MPDKEVTRAGFGVRAAAYIIDRVIIAAALLIVRLPLRLIALGGAWQLASKDFLFRYSALDVIGWAVGAAYLVLLTYHGGATIGKKVMRLRVEREDGAPLRFIDALYRETVGRFLSSIACLGYLMVLVDRRDRAFHDYLCDTRVVYSDISFRTRREAVPEDGGWTRPDASAAPVSAPAPQLWSVPGRTASADPAQEHGAEEAPIEIEIAEGSEGPL